MNPQDIEEIIACVATAAAGGLLAFLQPSFMPEPLRSLAVRIGRFRKIVGVALVLIAAVLMAT